jgi:hypothetical protein
MKNPLPMAFESFNYSSEKKKKDENTHESKLLKQLNPRV